MLSAAYMANLLANLSIQQLRRAVAIKERVATLETELGKLLNTVLSRASLPALRGRRRMSAAARGRIAAAQRARWAGGNGGAVATRARSGRRKMSARARARLAAVARARWAKAKAAGRTSLGA